MARSGHQELRRCINAGEDKSVLRLENAHQNLHISPEEFDAVAGVLSRTLDHFNVPAHEKGRVLAAFAAHKA